ncbi:MAB_1171c family putative transporter [Streptomyces desertarenae]|uniref:MAB_1171c family putative transporter n=1 Tax=Streptomyces desertarenae TaxID=2666184 RepID=A0ABW4PGJ6_9ACTN
MDSFEAVVAVLLWITTGWRATKVWRKGQDRTLWWTFFGLAMMMTLRLPAGRALDQLTEVTDLSYLLKHLFGGVLSSAALLAFLRRVSGQQGGSPVAKRMRVILPFVTAAAMAVLFFAELQPYETRAIFQDPTARLALLAYTAVFLGFLSASLLSGMRVCWRWGRDSSDGALSWGLRVIGAGLAAGVVYALTRIAALVAHMTGDGILPGDLDDYVSTYLLMAALLLIVVGSSLPVLGKLRTWRAERRALLRLHPLWCALTEATPSVRLDPPRGLATERLDPRNVHGRLYRRTIEIRDAALALSDYAPADIRERARQHVEARGLAESRATVTTEACWLAAARRSKLRGDTPGSNTEHQPTRGGGDLRSEISALTQLSDAYHSDLVRDIADACDRLPEKQT